MIKGKHISEIATSEPLFIVTKIMIAESSYKSFGCALKRLFKILSYDQECSIYVTTTSITGTRYSISTPSLLTLKRNKTQ
jgi:hypothetical protein